MDCLASILCLLEERLQADTLVLVYSEDLVRCVDLLHCQPLLLQILLTECELQLVNLIRRQLLVVLSMRPQARLELLVLLQREHLLIYLLLLYLDELQALLHAVDWRAAVAFEALLEQEEALTEALQVLLAS